MVSGPNQVLIIVAHLISTDVRANKITVLISVRISKPGLENKSREFT